MKLRILQFVTAIVAVLSLGASSVSACACAHHEKNDTKVVEVSCHEHSETAQGENAHGARTNADAASVAPDGSCVCVDHVSKVSPKSETLKLQKYQGAIGVLHAIIPSPAFIPALYYEARFEKPLFLSDSFYNLAPKRGPPRV